MFIPKIVHELLPIVYLIVGVIGIFTDNINFAKVCGIFLISSAVYIIRLRAEHRHWYWW